jgi:hypothetical protein
MQMMQQPMQMMQQPMQMMQQPMQMMQQPMPMVQQPMQMMQQPMMEQYLQGGGKANAKKKPKQKMPVVKDNGLFFLNR